MGIVYSEIQNELRDLGFEGTKLNMITEMIHTEEHLAVFQRFIIENDGLYDTQLYLISAFAVYLQELRTYGSYTEFANDYIPLDHARRNKSMDRLFDTKLSEDCRNKVLGCLDAGVPLEHLFDAVKHYRKYYSAQETMMLLSRKFRSFFIVPENV